MRATLLNAVDDERINCSFHKGFWEFTREVLAETCLLHWVQGSLFLRVHIQIGDRAGVLREVGGSLSKVGKGEGKTLVFDRRMVTVPFFQLIIGFAASNQGCPKIAFSFPPLMM